MNSWDGAERRRFIRADFPCQIIISKPSERAIDTKVENIGTGGLMVILKDRLFTGNTVGLKLSLGRKELRFNGRVVWAMEQPNPYSPEEPFYDIGIEFSSASEEDKKVIKNFVRNCTVDIKKE